MNQIVIAGAGIGGLTTALALARQGHEVRVVEQAPAVAPIGYGIQLGPNTLPLLEGLGIGQEVLANSLLPRRLVMQDASGEPLAHVELDDARFRERFSGRYLAIHRGDLHDILKRALAQHDNVTVEVDTQVCCFSEDDGRVRIECAGGREIDAAALIGADGLRSVIREKLHPADPLRPIGYFAHRSILPMASMAEEISRDDVVLWVGPGWHVIHYPLRDRSELNVVAVFKDALCSSSLPAEERRKQLLAHLDHAHPLLRSILASMDLERNWPIADRDPVRGWANGNVTLLGDSAHATLQSLAQGAGMAIEDAVVMAACVKSSDGNYANAFKRFERERFVRTARVTLESRLLWQMYHEEDEIGCAVRKQQYQERSSDDLQACLAWVWRPLGATFRQAEAELANS